MGGDSLRIFLIYDVPDSVKTLFSLRAEGGKLSLKLTSSAAKTERPETLYLIVLRNRDLEITPWEFLWKVTRVYIMG